MENIQLIEFGNRLRTARLAYGQLTGRPNLFQEIFAAEIGSHPKTFARWERGETWPPIGALVRVREVTGTSLDYLIAGINVGQGSSGEYPECLISFSARLALTRQIYGAEIAEVAKRMGVSVKRYMRWEKGLDLMPLGRMEEFAHRFNVTLSFLETGSPEGLAPMVVQNLALAVPKLWRVADSGKAKRAGTRGRGDYASGTEVHLGD